MPGFPSLLQATPNQVRKDRATQTACCQLHSCCMNKLRLSCGPSLPLPNDKLDIENNNLIDRRSPPKQAEKSAARVHKNKGIKK